MSDVSLVVRQQRLCTFLPEQHGVGMKRGVHASKYKNEGLGKSKGWLKARQTTKKGLARDAYSRSTLRVTVHAVDLHGRKSSQKHVVRADDEARVK